MGKSTKCIEMLLLLKGQGLINKEVLAAKLNTNKRNLVEYRKELQAAGYKIESLTGRYGGYQLLSDCCLPVLNLTMVEQEAMLRAEKLIDTQTDFLARKDFTSAMNKIRMQMQKTTVDNIYIQEHQHYIRSDIRLWIDLCEQAIAKNQAMEIEYKGMKDTAAKTFVIHPYEILHYQSAYYCLAYSLRARDFRNFKFSKERMKNITLKNAYFNRVNNFDVKDHVGTLGLIKDDLHEFEVLIRGPQALLVAEKELGLHPQMYWVDDQTLNLKTIMEGKMNVHSFLLSLGNQFEILSPQYLKDEITQIIVEMYEKNAIS